MMMDSNSRLQHRPYEPQQINGVGGGQQQDMYGRSAAAAAAAAAADRNYAALTNINRPPPSYSTEMPVRSSYDHVRPPSYPNPLNAAVAAAAAAYADRYESDQSCQRYPSEYGDAAAAAAAAAAMYQPHQMIMKPEQSVQMDEVIEPPLYPRYGLVYVLRTLQICRILNLERSADPRSILMQLNTYIAINDVAIIIT